METDEESRKNTRIKKDMMLSLTANRWVHSFPVAVIMLQGWVA